MIPPSKSRLTAKKKVSSRWASRANLFLRSKYIENADTILSDDNFSTDISTRDPTNSDLTNFNYTSYVRNIKSKRDDLKNNHKKEKKMNVICQIWHVICTSLNEVLLQNIDLYQQENQRYHRVGIFSFKTNLNGKKSSKMYLPSSQRSSNNYRSPSFRTTNTRVDENEVKIQSQKNICNYTYDSSPTKTGKRASTTSRTNLNESLVNIQISSALQSHLNHYRRPSVTSSSIHAALTIQDNRYPSYDSRNRGVIVVDSLEESQSPQSNNAMLLDILPTGYDRIMAWSTTVRHRNRAFLLLDLGGVIRSHARFVSLCGLRSLMKVSIQPQFCVTKNPNVELLRLLTRLGVDLRCSSVHDVLAVGEAFGNCALFGYGHGDRTPSVDSNIKRYERMCILSSDSISPSQLKRMHNVVTKDKRNKGKSEKGRNFLYRGRLVDDASRTRKPNSYLRRLFQAKTMYSFPSKEKNKGSSESHLYDVDNFMHLAVDGPDEVIRISNTMSRFFPNVPHYDEKKKMCVNKNGYILRMPAVSKDEKISCDDYINMRQIWGDLVLTTYAASIKTGDLLVGVSVDLSPWSVLLASSYRSSTNIEAYKVGKMPTILINLCTQLRLFRLLMLSVEQTRIRVDLTGLPIPFTRNLVECLTYALDTLVSSDVTMEELLQVHVGHNFDNDYGNNVTSERLQLLLETTNSRSTAQPVGVYYTADVSEYLVSNSGALCTRIIGKKSMKEDAVLMKGEIKSTIEGLQSLTKNVEGNSVVHYYIDDGCYGSLGSSFRSSKYNEEKYCHDRDKYNYIDKEKRRHMPIPLYGDCGKITKYRSRPKHTYTRKDKVTSSTKVLMDVQFSPLREITSHSETSCGNIKATVWGPTCDGLDKVCESVLLPGNLETNRDWLVFPHLGCGGFGGGFGLGTAFNGLDPPDTAYCVLDYFSRDFNEEILP